MTIDIERYVGITSGVGVGAGSRRALLENASSPAWTPFAFGSDLYLAIDPFNVGSMDASAVSSGLVSSITDTKGGRVYPQATTGFKPATLLDSAGRRIIRPDGTDDYLGFEGDPAIPLPCEGWLVIHQTAVAADANTRDLVAWGSVPGLARRVALRRIVDGGVNRARLVVPTAGGDVNVTNLGVDFSGPCVIRFRIGLADAELEVNGVSTGPVAATPEIGTTRMRLFANTADAPGTFIATDFKGLWIGAPSSAERAARMAAYCNARIA